VTETGFRQVYGPVSSRRLGRSHAIDVVPLKPCICDFIYCQLGRTKSKTVEQRESLAVDESDDEVKRKLDVGPDPDYITVRGSGEPMANSGIGDLLGKTKSLTAAPLAVGSLLWTKEVQEALMEPDIVLPPLDASDGCLFRYVNQPHPIGPCPWRRCRWQGSGVRSPRAPNAGDTP
jgi:wyosine [tRNA(Phe)-imidazoG37] synthetase (radical SAM superfamily)